MGVATYVVLMECFQVMSSLAWKGHYSRLSTRGW